MLVYFQLKKQSRVKTERESHPVLVCTVLAFPQAPWLQKPDQGWSGVMARTQGTLTGSSCGAEPPGPTLNETKVKFSQFPA